MGIFSRPTSRDDRALDALVVAAFLLSDSATGESTSARSVPEPMRPLTKVVLVLAVVVIAIGALFIASRDLSDLAKYKSLGVNYIKLPSGKQTAYSDPIATYERWRKRLAQGDTSDSSDPKPKPKPVAPPAEDVHIVAQDDSLYGICVEHYGNDRFVGEILVANPGIDPHTLRIGERIVLPKPGSDKPAASKPKRTKVYVVKKGDTLVSIARGVYGDAAMYPKIYEVNKDVLSSLDARLYVGMRLRLPEPP